MKGGSERDPSGTGTPPRYRDTPPPPRYRRARSALCGRQGGQQGRDRRSDRGRDTGVARRGEGHGEGVARCLGVSGAGGTGRGSGSSSHVLLLLPGGRGVQGPFPAGYLRVCQVWPRALLQPGQVRALVTVASVHRDPARGQRGQAPGAPRGSEGDLWQVWQRAGPRVPQRWAQEGPVPLLNIQQLAEIPPQR